MSSNDDKLKEDHNITVEVSTGDNYKNMSYQKLLDELHNRNIDCVLPEEEKDFYPYAINLLHQHDISKAYLGHGRFGYSGY